MIQCPYCHRTLSSDGSYRVHKHRFHNGLEYRQPIAVQEEAEQSVQEPVEVEHEPFVHETPEPQPEQPKPQELEHHSSRVVERGKGSDINELLAIGGAITMGILWLLFGKKQ